MTTRLNPTSMAALGMLAVMTSTLFPAHTLARSRLTTRAAEPAPRAGSGEQATTSLPTLEGEAAVDHLRQQGLYSSLGDAVREARFGARALPSRDAFEFANPETGLRATFDAADRTGTRVAVPGSATERELAIKLSGYGYGRHLLALAPEGVEAERTRVAYTHGATSARGAHSTLTEWFVNKPEGVEHGFVLSAPPDVARESDAALRVEMAIGGDFHVSLDPEARTVSLVTTNGDAELRYDELYVYDANRNEVPAHFELRGDRLAIVVDDRHASYPLTIDPLLAQTDRLFANLGQAGDLSGTAVSISGDTAIVGAFSEDDGANVRQGAAYVFVRSAGVWTQQQRLVAGDPASNDLFGIAVALDGDTVLVGASAGDADAIDNTGAAYVFSRSGDAWSELQKLTASDPEADAAFGISVALDAATAVIGASGKDVNGAAAANAGAAYVFALSGTTWTEQQKLLPSTGNAENDLFGADVDVSGDTVLVGSFGDDIGTNADQGSAFIFTRSGSVWTQRQKLVAVAPSADDRFGFSVALTGDTAVIGTPGDRITFDDQGSAYLFSRSGATWSQKSRLFSAGGSASDKLGTSVAIDGDTILAGAPLADVGADADQGSAAVFTIAPEMDEQDGFSASDGLTTDEFGYSIDVSGDTAVVGAPSDDVGANGEQGSAYVFVRSGDEWEEQAHLFGSNGQPLDEFGYSVAISGNTIVVGAPLDNVGANGDEGSVYVFVRNGTSWIQQDHLFASTGAGSDLVGYSVAISDDTLVAGAPGHSVGANGDQGAAYVFKRSGASWSQEAEISAALGDPNDLFGTSVAIDADRIVVGAFTDDVGTKADQGSAYVFERVGASWSERARLLAGNGQANDLFGFSVAVSGDTAVVGALSDDVGTTPEQGSAYVFALEGTSWRQQAQLLASDGAINADFGISVDVSGDTALVGAANVTVDNKAGQGAAYLFVRAGRSWSQHQKLTAGNGAAGDNFGRSVALSGDTAVIGAWRDTVGGIPTQGSAYAFAIAPCPAIAVDPSELLDATAGDAYSWDVTASGGVAPYNYSVSSGTLPLGLALDPTTGRISGTATVTGTSAFTITATDANLCTGSRDYALVVDCRPIAVAPENPALTAGAVGTAYAQTFTASGGAAPYTFGIGAGALPAGLTLDAPTGVLSGTPTESGTFSFQVVATDAGGCSGAQEYVLTITCATITIAPNRVRLATGTVGTPLNGTITATGGTAPYTWTIVAGALPGGLTLDPAAGTISGTPTAAGTFIFTVRATDANGCTGERQYRILIT